MAHIDPDAPDPAPDRTPVPKVAAATVAAALATIVVLIVSTITGQDPPIGLEGAVATVLAFAAGYLAPPRGS